MATENTATVNPTHPKQPKVVVITGPTGSGKSKLAVDLASHFPIEVINADSMQVYRGLDILTNKLPFSEQNGTTVTSPHLIPPSSFVSLSVFFFLISFSFLL